MGQLGASQFVFARTHQVGDLRTLEQLVRETAEPGDVLEIQPGTYFLETDRIEITRSGVPENPIVIRGVIAEGKRPVIDAGVTPEDYLRAIRLVAGNARSGGGSPPTPPWLKALDEVERPAPAFEPLVKDHGYRSRPVSGRLDIGAFEAAR